MDKTRITLEVLITEREGMIAENARRIRLDNTVAYGDEAFTELATQMRKLAEGKALPVISNYLTKEAGEHVLGIRYMQMAYERVLKMIEARQKEVNRILGTAANAYNDGRCNELEELREAIEAWVYKLKCSP